MVALREIHRVISQQRLICGDHMVFCVKRCFHRLLSCPILTANQFDKYIYIS